MSVFVRVRIYTSACCFLPLCLSTTRVRVQGEGSLFLVSTRSETGHEGEGRRQGGGGGGKQKGEERASSIRKFTDVITLLEFALSDCGSEGAVPGKESVAMEGRGATQRQPQYGASLQFECLCLCCNLTTSAVTSVALDNDKQASAAAFTASLPSFGPRLVRLLLQCASRLRYAPESASVAQNFDASTSVWDKTMSFLNSVNDRERRRNEEWRQRKMRTELLIRSVTALRSAGKVVVSNILHCYYFYRHSVMLLLLAAPQAAANITLCSQKELRHTPRANRVARVVLMVCYRVQCANCGLRSARADIRS